MEQTETKERNMTTMIPVALAYIKFGNRRSKDKSRRSIRNICEEYKRVLTTMVSLDPNHLSGTWSDDEGEFQYLGVGPLAQEKIEAITTRRANKRKSKKHCVLPKN